jgi:hypothetical protein
MQVKRFIAILPGRNRPTLGNPVKRTVSVIIVIFVAASLALADGPSARPDYCPLPQNLEFDRDTPYPEKIGLYTGTWEGREQSSRRKFCIALISIKGDEVIGIYGSELQRDSPGAWREVKGKFSQSSSTIKFEWQNGKNRVAVTMGFKTNGAIDARWTTTDRRFYPLQSKVSKVE